MAKLSIFNVFKKDALSAEEMTATTRLGPEERYEYFIKKVSKTGKMWVLCGQNWMLHNKAKRLFPLWPTREYATLCAVNERAGYHPESFNLQGFLESLLTPLCKDGTKLSIFETPQGSGLAVKGEQFRTDVNQALAHME